MIFTCWDYDGKMFYVCVVRLQPWLVCYEWDTLQQNMLFDYYHHLN